MSITLRKVDRTWSTSAPALRDGLHQLAAQLKDEDDLKPYVIGRALEERLRKQSNEEIIKYLESHFIVEIAS